MVMRGCCGHCGWCRRWHLHCKCQQRYCSNDSNAHGVCTVARTEQRCWLTVTDAAHHAFPAANTLEPFAIQKKNTCGLFIVDLRLSMPGQYLDKVVKLLLGEPAAVRE